jgi:hypothetical protein
MGRRVWFERWLQCNQPMHSSRKAFLLVYLDKAELTHLDSESLRTVSTNYHAFCYPFKSLREHSQRRCTFTTQYLQTGQQFLLLLWNRKDPWITWPHVMPKSGGGRRREPCKIACRRCNTKRQCNPRKLKCLWKSKPFLSDFYYVLTSLINLQKQNGIPE